MALNSLAPSFQVPYAAPAGMEWGLGTGVNGVMYPTLQDIINTSNMTPVIGGSDPSPALPNTVTTIAPQMVITFDTIGQIIFSTLGHARMPLRYLWVEGINASGDVVSGDTITFAAALCAPLDPLEEGFAATIFEGNQSVFDAVNGITPPANWDPIRQALLIASLATAVVYPGTEGQDPDPTILSDKGAALVSANRGIRYIVLQGYPATSLPQLSVAWTRSNSNDPNVKGKKKKKTTGIAVEFFPGAS